MSNVTTTDGTCKHPQAGTKPLKHGSRLVPIITMSIAHGMLGACFDTVTLIGVYVTGEQFIKD